MDEAAPRDRPLSVERLTEADLIAAGKAVATVVAIGQGVALQAGPPPFKLIVDWREGPDGELWHVGLTDVSVALDRPKAIAAADHLLQPILRWMRPRAVRHFYRSWWDEATPAQLEEAISAMTQAMSMPSADYIEPRWVEDRAVLSVYAPSEFGPLAFSEALALLAEIAANAPTPTDGG